MVKTDSKYIKQMGMLEDSVEASGSDSVEVRESYSTETRRKDFDESLKELRKSMERIGAPEHGYGKMYESIQQINSIGDS